MGLLSAVDRAAQRLVLLLVLLLVLALGAAAYAFGKSRVVEAVYRDKLSALSAEYEALRIRYDDAVKESAVTELVVDGGIRVVVRGADGALRTIDTDLDPGREIHVDFVVRDGRLFMRRLYDATTAPEDGLLVDPGLEDVDWDDPAVARGLTVYRGDLERGRWVVSSTGNGALDLVKVGDDAAVELRSPPPVRRFEAVGREVDERLRTVGVGDILAKLVEADRR